MAQRKLEILEGEKSALKKAAEEQVKQLKKLFVDRKARIKPILLVDLLEEITQPFIKIYFGWIMEELKPHKRELTAAADIIERVAEGKNLQGELFEDGQVNSLAEFRKRDLKRFLDAEEGGTMDDDFIVKFVEFRAGIFQKTYYDILIEIAEKAFTGKNNDTATKKPETESSVPKPVENLQSAASAGTLAQSLVE